MMFGCSLRALVLHLGLTQVLAFTSPWGLTSSVRHSSVPSFASVQELDYGKPTELPDSLDDAAQIAATAAASFAEASGGGRCRIDFDTSAGDETYTILKSSTEFMQKMVTALSYAMVPGLQQQRQQEMMKVATARAELKVLIEQQDKETDEENDELKKKALKDTITNGGRDVDYEWKGPKVRVYFPDEGNAALARRDWNPTGHPDEALVPPCVEFSSCGGVQTQDVSQDLLVFFFCPKASESDSVEELLQLAETRSENLKLVVFVNPNLVDMGVTGFGMAGRMLRERLIDNLTNVYYLRTLSWGALTRVWPRAFSVWQEDENAEGGYRLIQSLDKLPSNPEVEDIYDIANGAKTARESGGVLDQLGDFVNGMMRL